MFRTTIYGVAPLAFLAVLASTAPAAGSGFSLNTQSAKSLGAGTAGAAATPGEAGNAWFNPASIVGVDGPESSFSMVGVFNKSSYENGEGYLFGTVPVAGETSGKSVIGDGVFPVGVAATKLNDWFYAGVAFYAPVGFDSSYNDASVMRYHGTLSKVLSGAASPMIGIDLGHNWSIAGGLKFQYVDVKIKGAIDAAGVEAALLMTSAIPGTDDVFYKLSANDWGVGYTVGMHGDLSDQITVGVSFSSKVEHNLDGNAVFDIGSSVSGQTLAMAAGLFQDTGISGDFTTPAILQFGATVDVTETSRLLLSAQQTRWKSFTQLTTEFDNQVQPTEVTTQNWENTWGFAGGFEFDIDERQAARFGVMHEQDPANAAYSSPRVPGASRTWLAAGYSTALSGNADLHLAASYVISDTTPLNESGLYPENLFRGSIAGDVEISSVVVGVGIDWRY